MNSNPSNKRATRAFICGLALLLQAPALLFSADEPARHRPIRPVNSDGEQYVDNGEPLPGLLDTESDVLPEVRADGGRPPLNQILNSRPRATGQDREAPVAAMSPAVSNTVTLNDTVAKTSANQTEPRQPRLSDLTVEARQHRRKLSEFLEQQEPLRMRRPQAEYTFSIPVSPRMEVLSAEAEVHYTNSISLREDISQIALNWDGRTLAQAPLMKNSPSGRIREELPNLPTPPGYHPLTISVAQHYAKGGECEDPASPALWTQIDPVESWIAFEYRFRRIIEPVLSDLPDLIDSRLWSDYELTVVTSPSYDTTDDHLRWGSLVSQRAALLLDYKPLQVRHASRLAKSGDHVAIGTRSELQEILPATVLSQISESFIGIYPHPLNPGSFLVVVSGFDAAGVDRAVRAFALANGTLPAIQTMDVADVEIPEMPLYQADRTLISKDRIDFSELGFETATRSGMGADPFQITFRTPADIYAPEGAHVKMELHFAHGAALRADSVFNVLLNDRFEKAIHLKEEDGAVYRDYTVEIPLRSFRPGRNRIEFEPVMVPFITGHCEMTSDENLLFTLFEDSELKMPTADHYARLPDLQLFGWTAFPANIDPLGEYFMIHVASMDSETMASAWMIAGKMAQITGKPLVDLEVSSRKPSDDAHWMAVGTIRDLDRDLLDAAPVQFGKNGRIPAVLARVPGDRMGLKEERSRVAGHQTSILQGSNSTGIKGIVMQFQSPFAEDRTGMLVTAEDRVTLHQRIRELIQPGIWNGLKGDTMVWYGPDSGPRSQRLGESFYLGNPGFAMAAAYHLSDRPWLGAGLALAGVILLALLAKRALAKIQRRLHQTEPQEKGATA